MAVADREYLNRHKKFRIDRKKLAIIFPVAAIIVAIGVFWWLKLVGITVTGDAFCGKTEHTHGDECYASLPVCGSTTHSHNDECYKSIFICEQEEHIHTSDCYSDLNADLETEADWTATFESVIYTEDAAVNVLDIAKTQIGYTESEKNFVYNENGDRDRYTRYGEWYGNPYGGWNTMFVSFCLNYSGAVNTEALLAASPETMRLAWEREGYYSTEIITGQLGGRIAFFDDDGDGIADRTGIISNLDGEHITVIEGDLEGSVAIITYEDTSAVMGYGMTDRLRVSPEAVNTEDEEEEPEQSQADAEGQINKPTFFLSGSNSNITYTSDLSGELVDINISDLHGVPIENGGKVYIGEKYKIALEFSEINKGNKWVQFKHNEDGYLTYDLPDNMLCDPFTEWKPISAKTENGVMVDVGAFFVTSDGQLLVRFNNGSDGVNFVDKFSNVDFTVNLTAVIANTMSGESTEVVFNDKIKVELEVDGGAAYDIDKSHVETHGDDHGIEYTIQVKGTHGVVKDFRLTDEMWANLMSAQQDTIIVTDLEGNILDPQPTISAPSKGDGGFDLSGFPDFAVDEGFLIKYKAVLSTENFSEKEIYVWNAAHGNGKDSDGNDLYKYTDDGFTHKLTKLEKKGSQVVVVNEDGEEISLVKWDVTIHKRNDNLENSIIIDTLSTGLTEYYQGIDIVLVRYNQYGERLPDVILPWDQVTVEGNSMSLTLPEGHAFHITYYTHHETIGEDDMANVANTVKAYIFGNEETAGGFADIVGFLPKIKKSAEGSDGKYVYFTIETEVSKMVKDWGYFFLSDYAATWDGANNQTYAYENIPQDLVITATTESGKTVTFTHYVEGGPTENTYILVAPSIEGYYDTFDILFNTSTVSTKDSKWILDEDATITVTYKLPFDTRVGIVKDGERDPEPRDDLTLRDILAMGYPVSNTAIYNYTETIELKDSVQYEYIPTITKNSLVNSDGTIDYRVEFNNTNNGIADDGILDGNINMAYFNDSFDEKLEYVDGSFMLTCYSPWNQKEWLCKYVYNGPPITSNTMNIKATDLVLHSYNTESSLADWVKWFYNFQQFYQQFWAGGDHVYTYKLKIKDEYLYSTEDVEYTFDNTAEITWDGDGTSGPITDTVDYKTGLVDKHAVLKDDKLDFDIHINRHALDLLEGTDVIVVEDTMTENLSVYWSTIKIYYEDKDGNWIDFDSAESKYTYHVIFDPIHNRLTFTLPDSLHMRIDYTTLITESGFVSLNNNVRIDGKASVTDTYDAIFKIEDHSGEAAGSNHRFALIKQDGLTFAPLPDATFILYGPMGDAQATPPAGHERYIEAKNGEWLGYIGTYTTGADGSVLIETQYLTVGGPYALVETVAPNGYNLLDEPTYFYFHDVDPNGEIQTITTILAIENFNVVILFPETGGIGTFHLTTIGLTLMSVPILYSILRRKRERRLKKSP
ncbi:MAG: LPXTG cell wall anchor domain-containing protein [Clostridia bacterium]|nr:LPXTG cell wall anchor domain-containing protein [Clostridia bacterium]